jgi:pSer/pThr/pTyr-binding forkhead associated (FHA) protein
MARLVLLSEGLTGRSFELKAEKTTVGRVADNAFEISEASVSSHHAELTLRGNDLLVKDLGSTNGTFINGEKIAEGVVKPGQILRLGMVEMRLETGASASTKPKQPLDQTRVIPQGVKLDELVAQRAPLDLKNTAFSKKSNKATIIFVIGVVLVALVLLGVLTWILFLR